MKKIIVDKRISDELKEALRSLGLQLIYLEGYSRLGGAIASHPDTLLFKYKDRIFYPEGYEREHPEVLKEIREAAKSARLAPLPDDLSSVYPEDTRYNVLVAGGELFLKKTSAAGDILGLEESEGVRINPVKQGYPACSTLSLGNSAVTADRGLSAELEKRGISVTLIRPGHISLPPYEYGFIGGASFVLESFVYFFGDFKLHPDAELIEKAIRDAGLVPISLSHAPLVDLGGAVVIE